MKEPRDLTPTVFGYVVAYLLPGLSALVVLALVFNPIANLLKSFANAQSTVGLFFFVLLICLLLGMQLTACRWFLFEKLIYKSLSLTATDLSALRSAELAASFRLMIDEAYRYHQFFGAQVFVIPALLVGVLYRFSLGWRGRLSAMLVCLVLEVITWMTAAEGWRRYVERSRAFLTEVNHGNRI